jgi:hypothetical protein
VDQVRLVQVKVKGKVVPLFFLTEHHAMKAYYWGNENIAPLILWSQDEVEVNGQLNAPDALPPGKEPPVLAGYKLNDKWSIPVHNSRYYYGFSDIWQT